MWNVVGFVIGLEALPIVGLLLLIGVATGVYEGGQSILHAIPVWAPFVIGLVTWSIPTAIAKKLYKTAEFKKDTPEKVSEKTAIFAFVFCALAYFGAYSLHHMVIFFFIFLPFAAASLIAGPVLIINATGESWYAVKALSSVRKETRQNPDRYNTRALYAKNRKQLIEKMRDTLYDSREELRNNNKPYMWTNTKSIMISIEEEWLYGKTTSLQEIWNNIQLYGDYLIIPRDIRDAFEQVYDKTRESFFQWREADPTWKISNKEYPGYDRRASKLIDLEPLL